MRLISGDVAPQTCEYKLFEADGKCMGKLYVRKGDRMPPSMSKTQYYQVDL